MTNSASIEALLMPLDAARRTTYRLALRFRPLRFFVVNRDRRIGLLASVGVVLALALSICAPMLLLTLSPALFGIPHVASDVRYLVLRQKLPRWWLAALGAACCALFGVRLLDELSLAEWPYAAMEVTVAAAVIVSAAVAGAIVSRSARLLLRLLPALLVLSALAVIHPATTRLVFAHLHNLIAIVIWLVLFRRRALTALLPLTLIAIGVVLLASGTTLSWTAGGGGSSAFGLSLADAAAWLAPVTDGKLAQGIALTYVFLQAIHYTTWLGWIPQENVRGEAALSFRMSVRSLFQDFGARGVLAIAVLCAVMLGASIVDLHGTRNLYLSLAVFHGYLEVAMLVFLVVARRS